MSADSQPENLALRVGRRCREIGRDLADVLRSAGVSENFLRSEPRHGRRYDRLQALAGELRWTVADLMAQPAPLARLDRALLRRALRLAQRIAAANEPPIGDADLIADIALAFYTWAAERAALGRAIPEDDEEAFALAAELVSALRRE